MRLLIVPYFGNITGKDPLFGLLIWPLLDYLKLHGFTQKASNVFWCDIMPSISMSDLLAFKHQYVDNSGPLYSSIYKNDVVLDIGYCSVSLMGICIDDMDKACVLLKIHYCELEDRYADGLMRTGDKNRLNTILYCKWQMSMLVHEMNSIIDSIITNTQMSLDEAKKVIQWNDAIPLTMGPITLAIDEIHATKKRMLQEFLNEEEEILQAQILLDERKKAVKARQQEYKCKFT